MPNELINVSTQSFPALVDGSDLREAIIANTQCEGFSECDLVRVKTPTGGAAKWLISNLTGEEETDEIRGILVYYGQRGTLWPTLDVTGEGTLPILVTTDLVSARRFGNVMGDIDPSILEKHHRADGTYDWQSLPWNEWGTGKNGVGKRCKESRILMILRENEAFPLLIRAQPGSLKTIRPFVTQLPIVYWRAMISLKLTAQISKGSGQRYSQIIPKLIGVASGEVGAKIKQLYTDPLSRLAERAMESDLSSEAAAAE